MPKASPAPSSTQYTVTLTTSPPLRLTITGLMEDMDLASSQTITPLLMRVVAAIPGLIKLEILNEGNTGFEDI